MNQTQKESILLLLEAINISSGIDIRKFSRKREVVYRRYCFYKIVYDCFEKGTFTLEEIGKISGNKDHATVIHGLNRFPILIKYKDFKQIYDECLEACSDITISANDRYNAFLVGKVMANIKNITSTEGLNDIMEACRKRIVSIETDEVKEMVA